MKNDLPKISNEIRKNIIRMLVKAGTGHTAGPLGIADLMATLYFGEVLKYKNDDPNWAKRDRLILSCGHYAPALYATLAMAGFFSVEELSTLRKLGSRLQGHVVHQESSGRSAHRQLPGVENTGGPLGQGMSVAVGMAIAGKMDAKEWRVICISSDGEQEEGQTWEAYMTAAKYGLGNLIFIVDRNEIQISGNIKQIMPIEPLKFKYESFGLRVIEVDGHNYSEIKSIFEWAKLYPNQPKMVILKTTPGKGVSFMENNYEWHGKTPTQEEGERALLELEKNNI